MPPLDNPDDDGNEGVQADGKWGVQTLLSKIVCNTSRLENSIEWVGGIGEKWCIVVGYVDFLLMLTMVAYSFFN